jgi:hypothetical protein
MAIDEMIADTVERRSEQRFNQLIDVLEARGGIARQGEQQAPRTHLTMYAKGSFLDGSLLP